MSILNFLAMFLLPEPYPPYNSFWPWLWLGGLSIMFILHSLIAFVLALYVYTDAKKRKIGGAEVWTIFVLLTGLLGFLVYFLVRSGRGKEEEDIQAQGFGWMIYYLPLHISCWLIFVSLLVLGEVLLTNLVFSSNVSLAWWLVPLVSFLVVFPICFICWIKSWGDAISSISKRENEALVRKKGFVVIQLVVSVFLTLGSLLLMALSILFMLFEGSLGSIYPLKAITGFLWPLFLAFIWFVFYIFEFFQISRLEKKLA